MGTAGSIEAAYNGTNIIAHLYEVTALTASQVKFILPTCKTKVGTGGKRRKALRSPKPAAPSIKNLKRFTLSGILLDVKIIKKKKAETHLQQ